MSPPLSVFIGHEHLGNAMLLTVNGCGHTEISKPPAGTICQQNINPFP
jgi:hypothetical protein